MLLKLDSSHQFFSLSGIWNLVDDLVKRYTSILRQALCIISNPLVNSNWSYTVWKHSIQVKIGNFLSRHSHVTLKFDGCPWKTIGHLFYTMSSFVHFFKAMGEFKRVIVRKRTILLIFLSGVTLKFDGWLWKTIGHLFCTTLSFVHHFKAIGEFKQVAVRKCSNVQISDFFVPCDLKIWWMTLKNNRTPLLCCFKFKIGNFFCRVTLKFEWMTMKNNRAPLLSNIKLCALFHHHMQYSNSSYSPEMAKLGFDLCDLDRSPLTLTFSMDITSVIGNYSWKFHDDTMAGT